MTNQYILLSNYQIMFFDLLCNKISYSYLHFSKSTWKINIHVYYLFHMLKKKRWLVQVEAKMVHKQTMGESNSQDISQIWLFCP
jgi:hypothetical protein